MNITDSINAKGTVELWIYKDGELSEHQIIRNLIVTTGKGRMAHLLAGDVASNSITQIGAGTNGTATSLTDTVLAGGASPVAIGTATYPIVGSVNFPFTFGTGDANGITIQEFGLLTAGGVLFSRVTRSPIAKTSAISIVGTWRIDF